jgi:uncharacterized protein YegP (UPF0339 family)
VEGDPFGVAVGAFSGGPASGVNQVVFHLKAANGEIIASGQDYKSKAAAEKGIESTKTNAAGATVVDKTAWRAAQTPSPTRGGLP